MLHDWFEVNPGKNPPSKLKEAITEIMNRPEIKQKLPYVVRKKNTLGLVATVVPGSLVNQPTHTEPHAPAKPVLRTSKREEDEQLFCHIHHTLTKANRFTKMFGPRADPFALDVLHDVNEGVFYNSGQGKINDNVIGGGTINAAVELPESQHCEKIRKNLGMRKMAVKVPLLSQDVSAYLKLRHGILEKNVNNMLLVRGDASRYLLAQHRSGAAPYGDMRMLDLVEIVEFGAMLYWMPTQVEVACAGSLVAMSKITDARSGWAEDRSE